MTIIALTTLHQWLIDASVIMGGFILSMFAVWVHVRHRDEKAFDEIFGPSGHRLNGWNGPDDD